MNTVLIDPVLGTLTFNEDLNWYEGELSSTEHGIVRFSISLDAQQSVDAAIQEARALVPLVCNAIHAAKEFACGELLSVKNEGWLEEGEPAVSKVEFLARLSIDSVGAYADRECEVFFKDGDLFWGHTVLLSWNTTRGFYSVDIAG